LTRLPKEVGQIFRTWQQTAPLAPCSALVADPDVIESVVHRSMVHFVAIS
tara:strand:+ start:3044 stop:3193 length:150 start_codon:yes stop_codon:yes gene_type:complete